MDLLQVIVLALIQGITEFLPVSSSAHLILPSQVLGWPDQGLAFDVAVHVGTLCAVILYFRRDLAAVAGGWLGQLRGAAATPESRLGWAVLLGSVPTLAAGYLLQAHGAVLLRSALVIGLATIVFAILLQWADWKGARRAVLEDMGWRTVCVVAFAQVFALIPGTSRSGVTITAGLAMGLTREAAARFSFLLSIPVILGAGSLKGVEMVQTGSGADWLAAGLGAVIAGVSAFLCIRWFLAFVQHAGMLPFTIYRLLLGSALIGLALTSG